MSTTNGTAELYRGDSYLATVKWTCVSTPTYAHTGTFGNPNDRVEGPAREDWRLAVTAGDDPELGETYTLHLVDGTTVRLAITREHGQRRYSAIRSGA